MKFNNSLENFPSPLIAIDSDMLVAAKNYFASLTFPNIHVGAKISKYTDIDISREAISKGSFYGKNYRYLSCFAQIDGKSYTLLFISISSFGEDLLPFNPISLYKDKIALAINSQENSDSNNKKRQYIRNAHNNLVRANYFESFKALFEHKNADIRNEDSYNEFVELKKVCSALDVITNNYFENIDISVQFDYLMPSLLAQVSAIHITALLTNSLLFSVLNSNGDIQITLNDYDNFANIAFSFNSKYDFLKLYCCTDTDNNEIINSTFALCVSLELAKINNIEYSITKEEIDNRFCYTINHCIPITKQNKIGLSSHNSITELFDKYLQAVFFDEPI